MKLVSTLAAGAALLVAVPSIAQTVTPGAGATPGLSGTFYKVASTSTGFSIDQTLSQLATAKATGTFTSTVLGNGGYYTGNDNSSVTEFLGVDAASYKGPSNAGDLSDGIFELKGYFNATAAGTYNFSSNVDDNVQLMIGGQTIFARGCCGNANGNATFATPGLYAVDFVYSNTNYANGAGGAYVNLSTNALGSYVQSVPEPATWAMMLIGFGMIGFGLRYRRKSSKVSFA